MEHVLITGGLGFIGTHLADAYLAAGNKVTIIDSEIASVTDGREYDRHPACTIHRHSVEQHFDNGGRLTGYTRVIHAASRVGPASILDYTGRLGADMVRATECVIKACLKEDVPLCVFSSAEVYGRSGLLAEDLDIRVPVNYNARIEYAVAKTLTEAMTVNSLHLGLRAIVVRPFNVAGPRQSRAGGFVMPTFVQQALTGKPITVFATGEQVRAFMGAADLTRFILQHMDQALDCGKVIYNLGTPSNSTTIRALADRVKSLLDSPSEVIKVDGKSVHGRMYMEAESFEKVPVLGAAGDVGWAPEITLDRIVLETADHYRHNIDMRGADAPL